MQNWEDVKLAATSLLELLPSGFKKSAANACGLILGTGLGDIGDSITASPGGGSAPWSRINGFPKTGAPSHKGSFVFGSLGGVPILCQQGRIHLYEGYNPFEICMGVRVMALCGVRTLIVTNAAGALNPLFEPASLMCMADIINHTGLSPLTGVNDENMFLDLSEPFDPLLQELALEAALEAGVRLERGVYIGVHGPEMETPAETRMYRQWGADAIGMSSALEIIAARHAGLSVLGLSCLTNRNLPDCMRPAPIEEVIAAAKKTSLSLERLLAVFLKKWSARKSSLS